MDLRATLEEILGLTYCSGAAGSKGSTSWTGRSEKEDYVAFAGFMVYYLHYLGNDGLSTHHATAPVSPRSLDMLLAGYSYASLIVMKLPPIHAIVHRFETGERGTAAAEIIMRARRLAREARQGLEAQTASTNARGRPLAETESTSPASQHTRPSPVIVGGEETDPRERRRSRDTRRSASVVREVPRRIKAHIRRHSDGRHSSNDESVASSLQEPHTKATKASTSPAVSVSYLLISPVLPPLSHTLVSPSSLSALLSTSKGAMEKDTGVGSLQHPTLAVFGSADPLISGSKRLSAWCGKLAAQAPARFQWVAIDGAGHFWRETNVMRELTQSVSDWVKSRAAL